MVKPRTENEKQLDQDRQQKGATYPAGSVGTEVGDEKDDAPDHITHNGTKADERRGIER